MEVPFFILPVGFWEMGKRGNEERRGRGGREGGSLVQRFTVQQFNGKRGNGVMMLCGEGVKRIGFTG